MAKPTINDVARIAGVSKKTVSRVINQSPLLNEATRAKVEQVIAEIGYVPDPQARALALRRNVGEAGDTPPLRGASALPADPPRSDRKFVALIYDGTAAPSLADVQHGALAALEGSGYALTVHSIDVGSANSAAELRAFLEQQRPSGVLLPPPLSEVGALTALCREFGCDTVCIGAGPADDAAPVITSDDREAAAQAIGYLISLGHERIGMVTGPDESRVAQQRELGYLDAMADHDLDRGPALIATGDHSFQSGHSAGHLLLEVSPRPTAIFASNDEMAAGVVHAAAEKGIPVPGGLSVIGFEDTAIAARLCPQLTTVRVPLAAMAQVAARMLIGELGAGTPQSRFIPEFVARASTGPCPA
jgi:LacI family transcriptional regulator